MIPRQISALVIVAMSLIFSVSTAFGQDQITNLSVEYAFGERIIFRGEYQSDNPVQEVIIMIKVSGNAHTISKPVTPTSDGKLQYEHDLIQEPIRPFSTIHYWFEVSLNNGEKLVSPLRKMTYFDNRFDWKTREDPPFHVHWYQGDLAFAQFILDVAHSSLENIQKYISIPSPENVDIYIYASASEMRDTLVDSGQELVAAHADADNGLMVVSLPPGSEQRIDAERQIPHELMHIMLYQKFDPSHASIPVWLNEGLSSVAELYQNPDLPLILEDALHKDSFLPFATLCNAFPRDASGMILSYAQATSFTQFLYQQYGKEGITKLVKYYVDGQDCDRGVQMAFGNSLTQLETQWRQNEFQEDIISASLRKLFPWLLILLAVLTVPIITTLALISGRPN